MVFFSHGIQMPYACVLVLIVLLGFPISRCYSEPCCDSLENASSADSTSLNVDMQEEQFQEDVSDLFGSDTSPRDSLVWNTRKINSGHFAPAQWFDTARIVLTDSSQNKFFVQPFKNCITSDFGRRKYLWHYGVDIRLSIGDTVRCALDGVVRVREYDRHGYGMVIVVRHVDGLETIYGHLSKTSLQPNQRIRAGEVIGLGGNTGRSTGSHLHFEMRFCGIPFDPNHVIDFNTLSLKHDVLTLTRSDFAYLINLQKTTWHTVKKGECLGNIAQRFHINVATLCRTNHITPKTRLRIGIRLAIKPVIKFDNDLTLSTTDFKKEL